MQCLEDFHKSSSPVEILWQSLRELSPTCQVHVRSCAGSNHHNNGQWLISDAVGGHDLALNTVKKREIQSENNAAFWKRFQNDFSLFGKVSFSPKLTRFFSEMVLLEKKTACVLGFFHDVLAILHFVLPKTGV